MPLIVDTYNVLHVVGVLPPDEAGIDLPGLIRLIQHSRYRDERVELICDGSPREDVPPGKRGSTIVRYSGPNLQADDVIAQMIRASSIPKRLTVVSLDHAVLRAARRRRCRTIASDAFLRQLAHDVQIPVRPAADAAPPERISKSQLDAWQRYFNLDDDAIETLEAEAEREARQRRRARQRPADPMGDTPSKGRDAQSSPSNSDSPVSRGSTGPLFPAELLEEAEWLVRRLDQRDREAADESDQDPHA